MTPQQHMHEHQGMRMIGCTHKQKISGAGLDALLGNGAQLCTLDEYEAKLAGRRSDEAAAAAAVPGASTASASTAFFGAESLSTTADLSFTGPVEVEESPAKDEEQVTTAPVMRLVQSASDPGPSKARKQETPGMKRKLSGISADEGMGGLDDDDGSATLRSTPTSANLNTKKSKVGSKLDRDERQADGYVEKLNVNLVLQGEKLGVTLRHAKEEAKKMELKPKLLLSAHTSLVDNALVLAPQNIRASTEAQRQEAFDALLQDGRKWEWPLDLQQFMLEEQCAGMVNHLTNCMDSTALVELWKVSKPYALPQDVATLDIRKPLVQSMGHDNKTKVQLFFQIVLIKVLLVMLQAGESRKSHVQWLCKSLLDLAQQDLLKDIEPESMVVALSELQTVLVGVHAIVEGSWAAFTRHGAEIDFLKKPPAGSEFTQQISNALTLVEFYRQQLREFQNMKQIMVVHEQGLAKLNAFLAGQDDDHGLAALKAMEDHLKDFTDLKHHLPDGALSALESGFGEKLELLWKQCLHAQSSPDADPAVASGVQAVLAEGAIAFPESTWIPTAQQQFSQLLQDQTGEQKMRKMLKAVNDFFRALLTSEVEAVADVMQTALDLMTSAKGLLMPVEAKESLTTYWQQTCEEIDKLNNEFEPEVLCQLAEVLEKLLPWLPGLHTTEEGGAAKMTCLKACCKVASMTNAYMMLGKTAEARVAMDGARDHLAGLMSSTLALQKMPQMSFLNKRKESLIQTSNKLRDEAAQISMAASESKVATALEACKQLAGGLDQCREWDHGLASTVGFDKILQRAEQSLLKQPMKQIAMRKDELKKVLCMIA